MPWYLIKIVLVRLRVPHNVKLHLSLLDLVSVGLLGRVEARGGRGRSAKDRLAMHGSGRGVSHGSVRSVRRRRWGGIACRAAQAGPAHVWRRMRVPLEQPRHASIPCQNWTVFLGPAAAFLKKKRF